MMAVFASLAALAFGFGAAFAAFGPWLILPFAGIEIAALGTAFVLCGRGVGNFERVRVAPRAVTVEIVERASHRVYEFNPRWARLRVERGPQWVRVLLSQSGRELELGRHLGFERRSAFAQEIHAAFASAAHA